MSLVGLLLLVLCIVTEAGFWLWAFNTGHTEWCMKMSLLVFSSLIASIAAVILLGA